MKIIDYLRSYDILKNLENKWKTIRTQDIPTIVDPEEYRNRFIKNTEKYFLLIND